MKTFIEYLQDRKAGEDRLRDSIAYVAEREGITFAEAANRSMAHIQQLVTRGGAPMGIISAQRGGNERTAQENATADYELRGLIRQRKWGYTPVRDGFVERDPLGDRAVVEDSYFVVGYGDFGSFKAELNKLGNRFQQDAVMVIDPNTRNGILVQPDRSEVDVGPFDVFRHVGQHFTAMRKGPQGRAFAFGEPRAASGEPKTVEAVASYEDHNAFRMNLTDWQKRKQAQAVASYEDSISFHRAVDRLRDDKNKA